jgi:uncharacterized membrane protein
MDVSPKTSQKKRKKTKQGGLNPFRRALLRGLTVLLPPLLTILFFIWVGHAVTNYLLEPTESFARWSLVKLFEREILTTSQVPAGVAEQPANHPVHVGHRRYHRASDGRYVPLEYYQYLIKEAALDPAVIPNTADGLVRLYVECKYLPRRFVIPIFLCIFLLVLYLLGKFLAAGAGRFFWMQFERVIHSLPLVRSVYSSVKQVTDFMFNEREIEYTRVVAIEYPRKGIWSLGMVTGESMLDIQSAANEPVLSILIPTSPMPFTGYTMTVKRSETVDLNITIEQAFQFIVSCGVVVPPQQIAQALSDRKAGHDPIPPLGLPGGDF